MDENISFSILQIEKTKDRQAIQDAYRRLLVYANPEDDPEGFKRLREAYEAANAYANQPEAEEKRPETPVELWMEQIREVYFSLSKRCSLDCWRELMRDPICLDLDTSAEARDALLGFLADNYRLPVGVWKQIDCAFSLQEEHQELLEKFHPNFIDFVMRQCQSDGGDFPYELFRGDDMADYDTFLYHYYELCGQNDRGDTDAARGTLATLEQFPVDHPYLKLEKARLDRNKGRVERAAQAVHELLEAHGEDIRMLVYGGEILWDNGEKEQSALCFEKVLADWPTHYMANKYLARHYLRQGDCKKAKKYCVEALRISAQEEELLEDMREINEQLMILYEDLNARGEAADEEIMELGWCYLQNEQAGKGVALLEGRSADTKLGAEYHNLLSKCYFVENRFEDAVAEAEKCIPCITAEAQARDAEAKESEKGKELEKIPGRIAGAYELIARARHMLAKKEGLSREEQRQIYGQALEAVEKALEQEPDNRGNLIERVQILMDAGAYERGVDMCDALLEKDPGDFYAYVLRQRCYFELHNGQGVVDDFYQAKNIYAGYPDIYELAAEAFIQHSQYEDAEGILKQAKEANTASPKLDILDLVIQRKTAETEEAFREVYHTAQELLKKFHAHAGNVPKKDWEALYCETARCCQNMGNWRSAVDYYKNALEVNEKSPSANSRIVDILTDRLKGTGNLEYYREALPFAARQLELAPEAYYYIERGLLYMEAGKWEEAEADFRKAAELEPGNTYAYHNWGCVYKYTRRYKEAMSLFRKSIEVMEKKETIIAYSSMADCYERMGDYAKAAEWYRRAKELFPKNRRIRLELVRVYKKMGQFMQARREVGELYGEASETLPTSDNPQYYLEIGEIFLLMGKPAKALSLYQQGEKKAERKNPEICKAMADVYLYYKDKPKKALELYQKALELSEKTQGRYHRYCRSIMECYYELGEKEKAVPYQRLALESLTAIYGSLDTYLNHLYWSAEHRYNVGALYFYTGETEKAREYLESILCNGMCRHCTYQECEDYWEAKGLLKESEGDLEGALKCYELACKYQKDNHLSICKAAKLRKKVTVQNRPNHLRMRP